MRYNVLPLDDRFAERGNLALAGRPELIKGTRQVLFGGMGRLTEGSILNTKNKSHAVTAEVVVPETGALYQAERDALEARFLAGTRERRAKPAAACAEFTARSFEEADQATLRWLDRVKAAPIERKPPRRYLKIWEKLIKEAGYNFGYRSDFAATPRG